MQEWIKAHPTFAAVAVVVLGLDIVGAGLMIVFGLAGLGLAAATGGGSPAAQGGTPGGSAVPGSDPGGPSMAAGLATMAAGVLPLSNFVRPALPRFDARALAKK